ncbi:IS1595 family transposase [Cohnella sp. CFH 77786]|nr:IS1595 family transposase [Cohnella sp. CFH 77786]
MTRPSWPAAPVTSAVLPDKSMASMSPFSPLVTPISPFRKSNRTGSQTTQYYLHLTPQHGGLQFQKEFATEEQCADYLAHKRWKDGFVCAKCKHDAYYYIQTRQLYECQACHYQTSVTAGTLLHKTKLPLTTWFWAFYLVAHDKRGKSVLSLSQILDLNYRTAQRLMRKIRAAMADRDDQYKLSGTVDMGDAYFGAPRKGKDGRGTDKAKAVIALSKDKKNRPQYLRVQVIESVSIEEIKRVAHKLVEPGSTIVSDGHSSYKPQRLRFDWPVPSQP